MQCYESSRLPTFQSPRYDLGYIYTAIITMCFRDIHFGEGDDNRSLPRLWQTLSGDWENPNSGERLKVWQFLHENFEITWPYTVRATDRPSAPQAYQFLISHFLASLGVCNVILHIHVMINWQLSKQSICWPVTPDRSTGSGIDPSGSSVFSKLSADKLLVFKWSPAQFHFLKMHRK